MKELTIEIQQLAHQYFSQVVEFRRYIHMHPELSYEEKNTANFISEQLSRLGIPYETNVGGYGVIGFIEGNSPSFSSDYTLALRADIDALPIEEQNSTSYRSKHKGVMHACGHDVHSASLLGTAHILNQLRSHFSGTVKLIFQPAEEKAPGGASILIKEGVLKYPKPVQHIIGQHVQPYIPVGKVGIRAGKYMASADEIYLTVKGKGGHAAHPGSFVDPILICSHIIVALQQLISRSDPRIPSVLSFGKIMAEGATNIIPDEVHVEGTFRTMDESWRMEAHKRIHDIASSISKGMRGEVMIDIRKGYPVLYNNEVLTHDVRGWIEDYVGKEQVIDLDLWMAAEDFAFYTHEIPGCFYRIGTRNEEKGIIHGLHTPFFDIDEEALRISTGLMAYVALKRLENIDK